ncbi:hypothetical protein QJS10_CPB17g02194 [Acorus calamus]|uniref:Uncharacterized protein n=1 Tax=Acorus calamus TaxID=4465 RepID=A0AAV9CUP0_ACOCL|nr:hypothetical protein QJS10_CPB17g02194 [Acorus calamus]
MEESLNCFKFQSGRSKSSRLLMESLSSECIGLPSYEKASQSMTFQDDHIKQGRNRAWKFLRCVFVKNDGGDTEEIKDEKDLQTLEQNMEKTKTLVSQEKNMEKKATSESLEQVKEKKRKSWRPDPNRRWPVQGW